MIEPMNYTEIEAVIEGLIEYLKNKNNEILEKLQPLIKKAKSLDYSIKSYNEYQAAKNNLVESITIDSDHIPSRIGVFLLNYYGEQACNGRSITIIGDDPYIGKNTHDNSYILKLKDEYMHNSLLEGNPTAQSNPYDFNTIFTKQITRYADGNVVDTTKTAWDSFNKGYQKPVRSFDFKSALWRGKRHLHGVNYTISIEYDGKFRVHTPNFIEKSAIFLEEMNEVQKLNYSKYLNLLKDFDILKEHSWDEFIIKE